MATARFSATNGRSSTAGSQEIDFGAQGFGDMGHWNHLAPTNEQSHRAGPALFGKHPLGGAQAIVWNAALLFGLTRRSPDAISGCRPSTSSDARERAAQTVPVLPRASGGLVAK